MYGKGNAALKFSSIACLICGEDNISISKLTIESTANTGSVASGPVLVSSLNHSGITIAKCHLINGRILLRNNQLNVERNFKIIDNKIDFDFTYVEHEENQNDVITAHGIQGLWICGNIMNITNCHRVFKLQDTTG